jgi:SNF2 family DNA or RNA helicase
MPSSGRFTDARRFEFGEAVRRAADFQLPPLSYFNSDPCPQHQEIHADCRQCGIVLRRHQRIGVAWLYVVRRGLIADSMGTGKTAHVAGLLALLMQAGELDDDRAVIVVRSGSPVMQWQAELNRLVPTLGVSVATGTRQERVERYLSPWRVMLMGYHMFSRDLEDMLNFPINTLIVDDVDALRHRENKTAYAIKRLARDCKRVVILSGTPLQKRLPELHSVLEPIGGREIFGSELAFRQRYVREEKVKVYARRREGAPQAINTTKAVGYKNIDEFIQRIRPLALRRTAADITDVDLPAVVSQDVFLDLYPVQHARYRELQAGVLKIIKAEGTTVSRPAAVAQFTYGAMLCSGLCTLGEADRPKSSIKLDWLEEKLVEGDLSDEKVVCFMNFKNSIRAMQERLTRAGVGYVTIWGEEKRPAARFAAQEKFWQDPNCRVLMGTSAIEQSLNLQIARHLVNVDTILNAARMAQLSGRIRRDGSSHSTVYVHNLLTTGTQEEQYLPLLEREQALQDAVWNEQSELFHALSPLALLSLIGKSSV